MLVVLANPLDTPARELVARWGTGRARLMTARDLSRPGWRHSPAGVEAGWAVVDGEHVEVAALRGVLTRVPCVREAELPHIQPEDRGYMAAEMTAFLVSWLSGLPCPVLNRPSASSLLGPALGLERWRMLAAREGLALAAPEMRLPAVPTPFPETVRVTVVCRRWLGPVDEALGAQALRLASRLGVELLTVCFDAPGPEGAFVSAEPMVDVTNPAVAELLLERFEARRPV